MIVLGIDPGKVTGLAVLDTDARRVLWCDQTADLVEEVYSADDIIDRVEVARAVVYERMQSYGRGANSDFINTAEIGGYCRHALGAVPMTRPEVVRTLGLTGRGISKGAVWAETMRVLGGDDRGGKLCPRRGRKGHGTRVTGTDEYTGHTETVLIGDDCPICNGTGYERQPGSLAMFKGKGHAKDALSVAVAYALHEGLLAH